MTTPTPHAPPRTPVERRASCAAVPRRAWLVLAAAALAAGPAAARPGRYGPYATIRRAQEVADQFRRAGWRAVFFHDGDGWYVDVRR